MSTLIHATESIHTERLELIPLTPAMARADASDRAALGPLLCAEVPPEWPPPLLADHLEDFATRLERSPLESGSSPWYWVLLEPAGRVLVGSGGFFDLGEGRMIVGYSVLDAYHRRGIATEAVRALVEWAFNANPVTEVVADTFPELVASIGVLQKLRFTRAGDGGDPGSIRFALRRER